MADINIDTVKINECGQDLVKLSNEMNMIINQMFTRINNISGSEGIWVGPGAEKFKQYANIDKKQYTTFIDNFYKFGKYLIDYSSSYEQLIKGVKK